MNADDELDTEIHQLREQNKRRRYPGRRPLHRWVCTVKGHDWDDGNGITATCRRCYANEMNVKMNIAMLALLSVLPMVVYRKIKDVVKRD